MHKLQNNHRSPSHNLSFTADTFFSVRSSVSLFTDFCAALGRSAAAYAIKVKEGGKVGMISKLYGINVLPFGVPETFDKIKELIILHPGF